MAKPKKEQSKEREIIDAAMKRLDICVKAESDNRANSIKDLKFVYGDQWDSAEKKRRSDKGRPALQFNLLGKFVDQVVGDMLHNSPTIKLRPVDSKADVNIAKIRQGIINNIEYLSNSKAIYGYAATQQVACGFGAWRVLTRYTEENPFLQEAYLESVRNPFLVYLDPSAKDQNGADAKFGFLLEKMSIDDFEERYPKAKYPSDTLPVGEGMGQEHWFDGEKVTVAEYFTVEHETQVMHQLEDGRVVSEEEYAELDAAWQERNALLERDLIASVTAPEQPAPAMPPQGIPQQVPPGALPMPQAPPDPAQQIAKVGAPPKIVKTRDTQKTVIRHRILTNSEILEGGNEGSVFPGKYIPLVLAKGKELNIEGQNFVYGLVHSAIDSQKMYNYWQTSAAETIALAPKAPWLGTAKQFEGYENDYAAANVDNFPFLKYNPDPEAPGPPQRNMGQQPPIAIFQQIANGESQMKSVLGLFNADIGAPGSEQTGAAVMARQRPGDISTFVFSENLARAVLYTGRILNEIIPEIYDTERDVRLRDIDDSETFFPVNTSVKGALKSVQDNPQVYEGIDQTKLLELMKQEGPEAKFNDITVGKYDVVVTTGPSYATQRQESATQLLQLTQAMPQQMSIASDIIVKNLDFKDSDELAERLRKTLPPNLIKLRSGEKPPQPPPPPPEAQILQAKAQLAQAELQVKQLEMESKKLEAQLEMQKLQMEMQKMQMEFQNQPNTNRIDENERNIKLALERDRLELEKQRLAYQQKKDQQELQFKTAQHRDKSTIEVMKNGVTQ